MKYCWLLNIKIISVVIFFISFYFGFTELNAQGINQYTKDNKRTGLWKKYYSNKRIRYVGSFLNGKEVGVFKYYDITTSRYPVIIKEFSLISDTAKVSYYNLDGKLRTKGTMINKNRIGKWVYFFPNGTIFSEEFYENGKLEGELRNYYKNGNILEITQYSNGMKNGISKKFSDQEVLITKRI
jgi:antitoxin component YwqK of YwqJK toxin-antitoxin module